MAIKKPFNRAKIFQPFDALPGLRELLREKEREHEAACSPKDADKYAAASRDRTELSLVGDKGETCHS